MLLGIKVLRPTIMNRILLIDHEDFYTNSPLVKSSCAYSRLNWPISVRSGTSSAEECFLSYVCSHLGVERDDCTYHVNQQRRHSTTKLRHTMVVDDNSAWSHYEGRAELMKCDSKHFTKTHTQRTGSTGCPEWQLWIYQPVKARPWRRRGDQLHCDADAERTRNIRKPEQTKAKPIFKVRGEDLLHRYPWIHLPSGFIRGGVVGFFVPVRMESSAP